MEVAITRMSSRGQVVIPTEMREDMQEGDKLIIIRNNNQIIMKKADNLDKNFKDDLEFARRTEEAFKRIEEGKGISMGFDEFIEEMKKW
ncbi:AbrB/MazE/SpoVT family DNA-binding domain-containing protein [Candidatus Woesearchaeota archaeon]|nr:AbrB/MazE/SpoVT family DNA-binding domain-containing protein [Candidatus Woesearchaeota archaeon]